MRTDDIRDLIASFGLGGSPAGYEQNIALKALVSKIYMRLYADFDAAKKRHDYSSALDSDLFNLNLSMQGDFVHEHTDPDLRLVRF